VINCVYAPFLRGRVRLQQNQRWLKLCFIENDCKTVILIKTQPRLSLREKDDEPSHLKKRMRTFSK
jgi:hypothetical protein